MQVADVLAIVLVACFLVVVVAVVRTLKPRAVTVYQWQRGARFRRGVLVRMLEPGRYWVTAWTDIQLVDTRLQTMQVAGQEVLTPEGLSLKITLAGEYRITDAERYLLTSAQPTVVLYNDAQQTLRDAVGGMSFESILADRMLLNARMRALLAPRIERLGLELTAIEIRDIMLPGELKRAFAQAVTAQREGQAALERARAESASLRSLANTARLLQDHPGLLQLRALQAVEASRGNTLSLELPAAPRAEASATSFPPGQAAG